MCFRFLEHGEYKENLYGTSLDAIHAVMAKNKVCLVDVEPDVSSWAGCHVLLMEFIHWRIV